MAKELNPEEFSRNDRPREFEAIFRVEGEVRLTIMAGDLEEAKETARTKMEEEEFGIELDEVTDIGIEHVWKCKPMYRVTRDGRSMQVSLLRDGDTPREPDERGF